VLNQACPGRGAAQFALKPIGRTSGSASACCCRYSNEWPRIGHSTTCPRALVRGDDQGHGPACAWPAGRRSVAFFDMNRGLNKPGRPRPGTQESKLKAQQWNGANPETGHRTAASGLGRGHGMRRRGWLRYPRSGLRKRNWRTEAGSLSRRLQLAPGLVPPTSWSLSPCNAPATICAQNPWKVQVLRRFISGEPDLREILWSSVLPSNFIQSVSNDLCGISIDPVRRRRSTWGESAGRSGLSNIFN